MHSSRGGSSLDVNDRSGRVSPVVHFSPRQSLQLAGAAAEMYTLNSTMDINAHCMDRVGPGDSCYLEKGDYYFDPITSEHGTEDAPITITGDPDACIRGTLKKDRMFEVMHNYYIIEDICFNGYHDDESYVATAIYVLGVEWKADLTKNGVTVKSSVTGLILRNLDIRNFFSECIHFRYFVTWAEVTACTIQSCGIEAFKTGGDGKVGEGIYVGTALDQTGDDKVSVVLGKNLVRLALSPLHNDVCNEFSTEEGAAVCV